MSIRQTRSSRPLGDVSANIVQRATGTKQAKSSRIVVNKTTKDEANEKENGASREILQPADEAVNSKSKRTNQRKAPALAKSQDISDTASGVCPKVSASFRG